MGESERLLGKKVLIVEDEYFLADDLARQLRGAGADIVGPIASKAKAMAALHEGVMPDLAVIDINLNNESAFDLADELTVRSIPFVFATGYGASTIPPRFENVPRWQKPLGPDDVVRELSELAARR